MGAPAAIRCRWKTQRTDIRNSNADRTQLPRNSYSIAGAWDNEAVGIYGTEEHARSDLVLSQLILWEMEILIAD